MFSHQGDLVQGEDTWSIGIADSKLVMVKTLLPIAGERVLDHVSDITRHPNIAMVTQAFETDEFQYLQYDYSRITLEEVLNVHLRLEETHIRIIASSVSR
jgi:hypothetical protein